MTSFKADLRFQKYAARRGSREDQLPERLLQRKSKSKRTRKMKNRKTLMKVKVDLKKIITPAGAQLKVLRMTLRLNPTTTKKRTRRISANWQRKTQSFSN